GDDGGDQHHPDDAEQDQVTAPWAEAGDGGGHGRVLRDGRRAVNGRATWGPVIAIDRPVPGAYRTGMSSPVLSPYRAGASMGGPPRPLRSPGDGRIVAEAQDGGPDAVEKALASAPAARAVGRDLPAGERRRICQALSDGIAARAEELARRICDEA